ncbi:MAG: hypothetical protein E5Y63_29560 [Mesorhizobium sp.]|uniref:Calx-beta domain-containing protein n=1 Tax=Mesorhizobium sp. TaxID=1871066 RepID=UPI0011FB059D|nr:Calx-beta domain-containing protein [Mesorhizobium sp.]TIM26426.1 MAG: hypothetical protein E5Y63_29560 [Mesorhizobium sp.]
MPIINQIHGTTGDDDLIGLGGIDWIFGYAGKDKLYGQAGDDRLEGAGGNDLLDGGQGRDVMFGGAGDDIYRVDNPGDIVSEQTNPGVDDGGVDYVQSKISHTLGEFIEKLELTGTAAGNAAGNEVANTVKGNGAANIISGQGGSDILYGYDGNDILVGGAGKDYLTGGAGADIFVLGAPVASSAERIYDFESADRIGIYAADYGLSEGSGLVNGALDPNYFVAGAAATSPGHGQFVFNPSNALLYWDPDGTGSALRITLATLSSGAGVTASHFTIMIDTPPLSVSAATLDPLAEDSGGIYFLVSLQTPAREDVVVTYSTADGTALGGSDFVAANSAQIVIAAGNASAYVRIDLLDDSSAEGMETFSLVIESAQLASSGQSLAVTTGTAVATIVDEGPRVVDSIDTAALGIPDPAGLAYDPGLHTMLLSDSEVDEAPFNNPTDLYAFSLSGQLQASFNLNFTDEATGLAFDPNSGYMFISDDDDFLVYWVDPANPTVRLGSFDTIPLGGDDPEDLAIDPVSGHLFIVNGESRTIVETDISGSQVFSTITLPSVIVDPEALVYDARTDVFYVGGGFSSNVWCVDRSGQILETIDILTDFRHPTNNTRVNVKDLELAPASDGSGQTNLYVADFGWSHVNDGRIIEIDLGDQPDTVVMAMAQVNTDWS